MAAGADGEATEALPAGGRSWRRIRGAYGRVPEPASARATEGAVRGGDVATEPATQRGTFCPAPAGRAGRRCAEAGPVRPRQLLEIRLSDGRDAGRATMSRSMSRPTTGKRTDHMEGTEAAVTTTGDRTAARIATDTPSQPLAEPLAAPRKKPGAYRAVFACASSPSYPSTPSSVPRKGSGKSRAGWSEAGTRALDGR